MTNDNATHALARALVKDWTNRHLAQGGAIDPAEIANGDYNAVEMLADALNGPRADDNIQTFFNGKTTNSMHYLLTAFTAFIEECIEQTEEIEARIASEEAAAPTTITLTKGETVAEPGWGFWLRRDPDDGEWTAHSAPTQPGADAYQIIAAHGYNPTIRITDAAGFSARLTEAAQDIEGYREEEDSTLREHWIAGVLDDLLDHAAGAGEIEVEEEDY